MHLFTAGCICISGFWGLCPQIPTVALFLDPTGGLPSPRPSVPTIPPNPGYATEAYHNVLYHKCVHNHYVQLKVNKEKLFGLKWVRCI